MPPMWRAFVPVKDKSDLDAFPSWLVSFDGEHFIEVRHKPDFTRETSMRVLWGVVVDGPARPRRGQPAATTLQPEPITQKEIELVGGTIEIVDANDPREYGVPHPDEEDFDL